MRVRVSWVPRALPIAALLLLVGYCAVERWGWDVAGATAVGREPRIDPDYADVAVPPNVAPLNFEIEEDGDRHYVRVESPRGRSIEVRAGGLGVRLPLRAWREVLEASRGGQAQIAVYVRRRGRWERYEPMTIAVQQETVDPYMVYRLINPMYSIYVRMSIRQRNIEDYADTVVWDNSSFKGCMNCHTFFANQPEPMVIHVRSGEGRYGSGMLLVQNRELRKLDTRTRYSIGLAGFTSWHPSGRALAFSMNKVRQLFHTARTEVRDGIDMISDMAVYLLDSQTVASPPALRRPDRLETWPAWSADGRYLYYCSAPMFWSDTERMPPERYDEVRYDLMRISYDLDTGEWGEPETVLSASQTGLSITQPRPSPDGRFLAFCMSDYSTFPTFQPSSDLYLMDLRTGRYSRMECNSERAESWHSWSSNSRWLVFSSKRPDGLFLKPYFTYVDEAGRAHKPFLLPQRDPVFYDGFFKLYQMPELVRGPVTVAGAQMLDALTSGEWLQADLAVTGATPRGPGAGP